MLHCVRDNILGNSSLLLVGETRQSPEDSTGRGFLLSADSSGNWVNYRELPGSERWGHHHTITITPHRQNYIGNY